MTKDFKQWLSNCHKKYDKQILFSNCVETYHQDKETKTKFTTVEWGYKSFTVGDLVSVE